MYHGKRTKKSNIKISINTIVVTVFTVIGVIISFLVYRLSIESNRNSVLFEKPSINLNITYADEEATYINKVAIEVTDQTASQVRIDVEPYLNVFFYLPEERALVREILPIWDLEKVSPQQMPYELRFSNSSHGQIAEIILNQNSYSIVNNISEFCSTSAYNDPYTSILPDIFGGKIMASISFEFYIIVDYCDNLGNAYNNTYLCTTGYRSYTGNVFGSIYNYDSDLDLDEEIIEYNIEHAVIYCKLKTYLNNMEFDAALEEVGQDDIVFNTYYDFCSRQISTSDNIQYVVGMNEELDELINCAYARKQLLFFINLEKQTWNILK